MAPIRVATTDGREFSAALVVGADGSESAVAVAGGHHDAGLGL